MRKPEIPYKSLEFRQKYPHMEINGLGVTRNFLKKNCLKLGDKCPRFRSVGYSDGRIQAVMCFWGHSRSVRLRRVVGNEQIKYLIYYI